MMIKLSDGCYVAADQIAEVTASSHGTHITVRMKNGIGHTHTPGYGQGVYAALDELIANINRATQPAQENE